MFTLGSLRLPLFAATGAAATLFAICGPAIAAYPGPGSGPGSGAGSGGGQGVRLTPSSATPGGDVDIRTEACGRAVAGTVSSQAFVSTVRLAPAADGGLFAEAVISSSATVGSYPVYVNCDGLPRAAQGTLGISRSGGRQWAGGGGGGTGGAGGSQESQWGGGGGGAAPGGAAPGGGAPGGGAIAGAAGGQEKQWGNDTGHGDKQWADQPSTPIAPVPAGGGGAAKLLAARQKPHETGVPVSVAAGVVAVAGLAGLAVHRRRRGRGRD